MNKYLRQIIDTSINVRFNEWYLPSLEEEIIFYQQIDDEEQNPNTHHR